MERAARLTNCIITIKTYFNDSTLRYTLPYEVQRLNQFDEFVKRTHTKQKRTLWYQKKKKKKNKAAGIETMETGESFRK